MLAVPFNVCVGNSNALTLTVRAPILIDGDSQFTAENGVTAGSGASGDPFVIEGWDISASSAHGIAVRNTRSYFMIQDVSVHDGYPGSYAGIRFDNVSNGRVRSVQSTYNLLGVWMVDVTRTEVMNSTFSGYSWMGGISCEGLSSNNTIGNNHLYDAQIGCSGDYSRIFGNEVWYGGNGIGIGNSHHSVISGNKVDNCYWYAIILSVSYDCAVTMNEASYSSEGISIDGGARNLVSGNLVHDNGAGITIAYGAPSTENVIIENQIEHNSLGVMFSETPSSGNFIYHNNFVSNWGSQASIIYGSANTWDDGYPSGGNYWSDYSGADVDPGDGIGDTPYVIDSYNQDSYPLMTPRPVGHAPVALFDCIPTTPSVGELITFDASTSFDPDGDIIGYHWIFGDGTTGDGVVVTHAYASDGVYEVTLTVTDYVGLSGALTVMMPVSPLPPPGTDWMTATLDIEGDVGSYSSIATDSANKIHASYYDYSNGDLKYATSVSGSWTYYSLDSAGDVGAYTSIAVDSNDKVHISYMDVTNGDLKYATNAGGSWACYTLDSIGTVGFYTSIAVDSNNKVHLSYLDGSHADLKYATNVDGSWACYTLDSAGNFARSTSIAVDSSNNVHISYYDATNLDLKYATNVDGSWSYYTLDSTGNVARSTSIAVDSSNKVHISYYDLTNLNLKYATNVDGSWTYSTLDSAGDVGLASSIAIDLNNKVHIGYYDSTNGNLKYATNVAGSWACCTLDRGYVGRSISIAVDSNDKVHMSYYDYSNRILKYATNAGTPPQRLVGWGTPQLIETDNLGYAFGPQVAVDSSGNAIAVWYQYDGLRDSIWSNRYVVGTGWGTAQLIETDNSGGTSSPQVSMDGLGNAIAVWYQYYDGWRIWSNRYVVGTGWGTAQLMDTLGYAYDPEVSADDSGNAIAVWLQYDGIHWHTWSNRYVVGAGWGTAQPIETDNSGDAREPDVSVDDSGNAVAVWDHYDGVRWNIWSNRYVVGTGWGTAQLIETNDSGDTQPGAQVSVDGSGNAIVVWYQYDGLRDNIWSNRYVVGEGWGTAQLIETDNTGDAYTPHVSVDSSGNVIAVWNQLDGFGHRYSCWSNRYVVGEGWGTAQLIETDNLGDTQYNPQVSTESSGNATAVWVQVADVGSRWNIWSNRYVVGTGWGTAQLIETNNSGDAYDPQVSVDSSGNAIAVWEQNDGVGTPYSIWSNRYVAPNTPPTASFTVSPPLGGPGTIFTFDASSSSDAETPFSDLQVRWDWENDGIWDSEWSTEKITTHQFASPGTYAVCLEVKDIGGLTDDTTTEVVISATHLVTKGTQGPSASAVTWEYVPIDYGNWTGHIVNNGLRSLVVNVYDNTTGVLEQVMHQRIRFAAYNAFPTGEVNTMSVTMSPTHKYSIEVIPNGPKDSSCTVEEPFKVAKPPVAIFIATVDHLDATVDASDSYDPYNGTIVSYDWTFGDGGVASGIAGVHTYASPGIYTITLTVTDDDGMTGSTNQSVAIVDNPPVASFTLTRSGLTVYVDASGSGDDYGIVGYDWFWGDGTSESGPALSTHTYAIGGLYTIALTVTDTIGQTGVMMATVRVAPPESPIARFTATVNFLDISVDASASSDSDGWIASYAWDFGDGTTGSGLTASHTYESFVVTYTITLTVTDNDGLTNSTTKSITVHPLVSPVANFTAMASFMDVSVDASLSTDPDGWIESYAWDFDDGTLGSGPTASHTYTVAGTYNITLTVTDNDGLIGTTSTLVNMHTSGATFQTPSSDHGEDTDANGLYDWLVIEVALDVYTPGTYRVDGTLTDIYWNWISSVSESAYYDPGLYILQLRFEGWRIQAHGLDGVMLAHLYLYDEWGYSLYSFTNTTSAYAASTFEYGPGFVPPHFDVGLDNDSDGLYDFLLVKAMTSIRTPGWYHVIGNLRDSGGTWIDDSVNYTWLGSGIQEVWLTFEGWKINSFAVDGPLTVELSLYDEWWGYIGSGSHNTEPYLAGAFEFPAAFFAPPHVDYASDSDSDGVWDFLTLEVSISVQVPGEYRTEAALTDMNGSYIANAYSWSSFGSPGSYAVTVDVEGWIIHKNGVDGPFRVLLDIYDTGGNRLDADTHETGYYAWSEFELPPVAFSPPYNDYGVDANSDGKYDYLVVEASLDVRVSGYYPLRVSVYSSGMWYISEIWNSSWLDTGVHELEFRFYGWQIYSRGVDGPYTVAFDIWNQNWTSVDSDSFTTQPYLWTDFQKPSSFAPPHSDRGVDGDGDGLFDSLVVTVNIDVETPGTFQLSAYLDAPSFGTIESVWMSVYLESGLQSLELRFNGTNIFRTGMDGPYSVNMYLSDSSGSGLGSGTHSTAAYLSSEFDPPAAVMVPPCSDRGVDTDADGLYEFLEILVPVHVNDPGMFRIYMNVNDKNGNYVFGGENWSYLEVGDGNFSVLIDGWSLRSRMIDGAYTINVWLYDQWGGYLGYLFQNTSWYAWKSFEAPASITGLISEGLQDTDGDGLAEYLELRYSLEVEVSGYYYFEIFLWDSSWQLIEMGSGQLYREAGTRMVTVGFDGSEIAQHGVDGPYVAMVVMMDWNHNLIDAFSCSTQAYLCSQFDPTPI